MALRATAGDEAGTRGARRVLRYRTAACAAGPHGMNEFRVFLPSLQRGGNE